MLIYCAKQLTLPVCRHVRKVSEAAVVVQSSTPLVNSARLTKTSIIVAEIGCRSLTHAFPSSAVCLSLSNAKFCFPFTGRDRRTLAIGELARNSDRWRNREGLN